MCVMHPLHQHGFGHQQSGIRMMIEYRVDLIFLLCFSSQLPKRSVVVVLLQIVNDAPANYTVDEAKRVGGLKR
jgi:hypothetical protein